MNEEPNLYKPEPTEVNRNRVEELSETYERATNIIEWAIMFRKAQTLIFIGGLFLLLTGHTKAGQIAVVYSFVLYVIAGIIYGIAINKVAKAVKKMLDR